MKDIENIWRESLKNNKERNIFGLLLYKKNQLIQLLEGEEKDVTRLAQIIKSDNRHFNFRLLGSEPADHMYFKQWRMGYILDNAQTRQILGKYFPRACTLETLTFKDAGRLLEELANQPGVVLDMETPLLARQRSHSPALIKK